ncbi:ParB/RepB/Spo0J family partition protein [Sinanaerobacter sp. ZZT-01]|uniref:ParB/RepB/Spo0J family partition protein n=1 Tax=Sinanaerobacter sp. ZZT-01 TaxID=3111540 RepID=UPI002D7856B4|nr:ParB/RepB/Spo0J family partition protein [Sinanaerobacter sp. ZZT-01]WRR94264.1 ParB/RepB/Spo0J family partition protein [Sinanaerobacter sp. ZZT-01]
MAKDDFKNRLTFSSPEKKTTTKSVTDLLLGISDNVDSKGLEFTIVALDLIDPLFSFHHSFEKTVNKGIEKLADKIRAQGVLEPVILRQYLRDGIKRYELLAGHRRCMAARLAGLTEVPAVIVNVNDANAKLIATDTNLEHREEILPSEMADAYKLQVEALKQQGKQRDFSPDSIDKSFRHILPKVKEWSARGLVAALNGISVKKVACYLRLNELNQELLDLVDDKQIPIYAGADLSHLSMQQQQWICEILMNNERIKITSDLAVSLKDEKENLISKAIIEAILNPPAQETKEHPPKPTYKKALRNVEKNIKKLPEEQIRKIELMDEKTLQEIILVAIQNYVTNH